MADHQDHDSTTGRETSARTEGEVVFETPVTPSTRLRTHVVVLRRSDGTCTASVTLGGELCPLTAPDLEVELRQLLDQDVVGLAINLRQLTLCTSHGLDVFDALDVLLRETVGGALVLHDPVGVVDRVLRIVRTGDPTFSPAVLPAVTGVD